MLKIVTSLLFGMLMLSLSGFCAQSASDGSDWSYDIDDNSFNVSDEQYKDVQEIEDENEKQTFESKVINSSHFSSDTATKTWIPFRKNNE